GVCEPRSRKAVAAGGRVRENRIQRCGRQLGCKNQGSVGRRVGVPVYPEIPDIEGVEGPAITGAVILSTHDWNRGVILWLLLAINICRKQSVPNQRQQVRVV